MNERSDEVNVMKCQDRFTARLDRGLELDLDLYLCLGLESGSGVGSELMSEFMS